MVFNRHFKLCKYVYLCAMKFRINHYAILSILLSAAVSAAFSSCVRNSSETGDTDIEQVDTLEVAYPLGFCPDSLDLREGKVKNGQYFTTLMTGLGMTQQQAYDLSLACGDVFDVGSLRVGQDYRAYYSGTLEYVVYDRDKASCVVFDCTEPYGVWVYDKPVEIQEKYADVTINSSLWNDMRKEGVSPLVIVGLSDIYAWTIDFFGLQKGDRFRVLYEQKVCDGEVIAIDTVRYAVFSHDGKEFPMVMYNQHDGGNIWWNEKGESMRKAFLKAP